MKTCANCETELITSLDEYGPVHAPLCRSCFFEGKKQSEPADCIIRELEADIEDLKEEIRDIDREIDDLEDDKGEKKDKIRELRARIKDIQNPQPKAAVNSLLDLPMFQGVP
jgi:predicted nuclease with TOPRIM domain